jgi:DNA-binding PucR family transcriptional regulator
MNGLARAVYAIAKTKRRRFLWCVWWTGEPTAKPFRPPDAWGGGAHTEDEARALAERAAGMPLDLIDGHWAGAWKRMRAGLAPFPKATARPSASSTERVRPIDPYVLLGVDAAATLDEVKIAFRKKALEHHPDQGGTPAAFMAVKRAYDSIVKRRARRRA